MEIMRFYFSSTPFIQPSLRDGVLNTSEIILNFIASLDYLVRKQSDNS